MTWPPFENRTRCEHRSDPPATGAVTCYRCCDCLDCGEIRASDVEDAWTPEILELNDACAHACSATLEWHPGITGGNCTALIGTYGYRGPIEVLVTLDGDPTLPPSPDASEAYEVSSYVSGDILDSLHPVALGDLPAAAAQVFGRALDKAGR